MNDQEDSIVDMLLKSEVTVQTKKTQVRHKYGLIEDVMSSCGIEKKIAFQTSSTKGQCYSIEWNNSFRTIGPTWLT